MEIAVSITLAAALVDRSERTVGRWLDRSAGQPVPLDKLVDVARANDARVVVPLDGAEDLALLLRADEGLRTRDVAASQAFTDLGLAFLQAGAHQQAVAWLSRTAEDSTEAMHHLSRCYLEGLGVAQDVHAGMMWLHRAAAGGHTIAKAQAGAILSSALKP